MLQGEGQRVEQVCGLARVAAAALSGQPASTLKSVDLALAVAHRIAPLLHIAFGAARPDLAALFEENARAQAASRSILREIAALSAEKGFAWLVLNGEPQAQRLYPDPAWRASSGIDILVPAGQSLAIADTLRTAGWSALSVPAPAASLGRAGLRTDPAITLTSGVGKIALHERLFFAPGPIGDLLASDGACPRRSAGPGDIPAPELGAPLPHDFRLAGKMRNWPRINGCSTYLPQCTASTAMHMPG